MSDVNAFDRLRDTDLREHLDGLVIPKGMGVCEWCGSLQDIGDMKEIADRWYCIKEKDGVSCFDIVSVISEEV